MGEWWERPPPFLHADSELAGVSPAVCAVLTKGSARTPRRDPWSTHKRETRLVGVDRSPVVHDGGSRFEPWVGGTPSQHEFDVHLPGDEEDTEILDGEEIHSW